MAIQVSSAARVLNSGPDAVLAAPAFADVNTLDPLGYRQGSVLAGGSITLSANKGFIQTDPGSRIEVDGAAGVLDLPTGASGNVQPTVVAGNAGSITLDAREGLVLQGTLSAQPASYAGSQVAGAAGGSLTIGLGNNFNDSGFSGVSSQDNLSGILYPTAIRTLTLVGTGADGSEALSSTQQQSGTALIDASSIEAGGFSAVSLRSADTIAFAGNVSLSTQSSLTLDAPLLLSDSNAQVKLASAYVALGNSVNNSDYFDTSFVNPNAPSILSPQSGTARCQC